MNSIQRESMNLRERIEKWAGRHRGASFDFAKELGISYTTVANWLSKRRSLPNEAIRPKICKLLGITEEELLRCFPPQSRGATAEELLPTPAPLPQTLFSERIRLKSNTHFHLENYKLSTRSTSRVTKPSILLTVSWSHLMSR